MDEKYFKTTFVESITGYKRWFTEEELRDFQALPLKSSLVGNVDAYQLALAGDFSKFEQLSSAARIYLASKFMYDRYPELYQYLMDNHMAVDEEQSYSYIPTEELVLSDESEVDLRRQEYRDLVYNPLLRLALSVKTENPYIRSEFMLLDSQYNTAVMQETLNPIEPSEFTYLKQDGKTDREYMDTVSAERRNNDGEMAVEEAVDNIEKQTMLAKIILLAHIGDCYTRSENDEKTPKEPYVGHIANLFAHCSRVSVILPRGVDTGVIDAIMGADRGKNTGVYKRSAATHDVQPRKYDSHGNVTQTYKELKPRITCISNQYGMDVPVGGLGRGGVQGDEKRPGVIKGDGTCGHLFIHAHEGNADETGVMLFGFESDSPSAPGNQQGHTHSMRIPPVGEKMSSFCAQRTDEFGSKYGGRVIDLSGADPAALRSLINSFDEIYRGLQVEAVGASDPDNEQKMRLVELNRQLCDHHAGFHRTAQRLCELGVNWQDVRDVMKEIEGVRESDVTIHNARVLDVDRVKQVPKSDTQRYEEYRRFVGNKIRRRNGMTEIRRSFDSHVYKDNEEKFSKILTGLINEGMNDRDSYGVPYNNARPQDRHYLQEADAAAVSIGDLSEGLKPVASIITQELKRLSENIADLSMRIYALGIMKEGVRSEFSSLSRDLRAEFSASAAAFESEALIRKSQYENEFTALQKVMLAMEGKQSLKPTLSEETYLNGFFSSMGVDYGQTFKGKIFKEVLPDEVKTLSIGNSFGMDSLDKWRNAPDIVLKQLFINNFASDKAALEQLDFMGYDVYDTIFISEPGSDEKPISFGEYFRNDFENSEARFMRMLLNREITADVISFDSNNKVHSATVKVHSEFADKEPTTWQKLRKNIPLTENELYAMSVGKDSAQRRETLERAMTPKPERMNRASTRKTLLYMEDSVVKEEMLLNKEIIEAVAEGKGLVDYNKDELNITAHEVQLYMLSKGMLMSDIMKPGAELKEKARLAAEYFDLKSDPESAEYRAALDGMRATLASAALPGGELSKGNNIINNLPQIVWLKKASDLFSDDVYADPHGVEEKNISRGIRNISRITQAQLNYVQFFKGRDYLNGQRFDEEADISYAKSKLFLESCELSAQGSFYSTVDTDQLREIIAARPTDSKFMVQRATIEWLSDRGERNLAVRDLIKGELPFLIQNTVGYYGGKDIHGTKDLVAAPGTYMLKEDAEEKNQLSVLFSHLHDDAQDVERRTETILFSKVMNLSSEEFMHLDIAAAAKQASEKATEQLKHTSTQLAEAVDAYTRDYLYNSKIRNLSVALNRKTGKRDVISNGGFNTFPAMDEEQTRVYEKLMSESEKIAETYRKDVMGFIHALDDKLNTGIYDRLKKDMKDSGRGHIFSLSYNKSEKGFDIDISDVFGERLDFSSFSDKFDFIKSEEDIKSYLESHPKLKKDYSHAMDQYKKIFKDYKNEIDSREKQVKEILAKESSDTPMLKDIYQKDAEYVVKSNRDAFEKYKFDVQKYALCYFMARELGLKAAEKENIVSSEIPAEPKEIKTPQAPESDSTPAVLTEFADRQSLETALRAKEIQYAAAIDDLNRKIAEQEEIAEHLNYYLTLETVDITVKQKDEYIKAREQALKKAAEESRKEAKKAEHDFKKDFVKNAKQENPEMSELKGVKFIADIEKLGEKFSGRLQSLSAEGKSGTAEFEETANKAKFYTELASKGRKEANELNQRVYDSSYAQKKAVILNDLYKKHFGKTYDQLAMEIKNASEQIEAYQKEKRDLVSQRDAEMAQIREKGKIFSEPEKAVVTHSLSEFMKTTDKRRAVKPTQIDPAKVAENMEKMDRFLGKKTPGKG